MGTLIYFYEYKQRYNKGYMYWKTSKCSARELARYVGITHVRAIRWELDFIKRKKKETNGKTK